MLEERLSEASSKARRGEEDTTRLDQELNLLRERLEEKEILMRKLGAEMSANNEEIRNLKESLRAESERQVNAGRM